MNPFFLFFKSRLALLCTSLSYTSNLLNLTLCLSEFSVQDIVEEYELTGTEAVFSVVLEYVLWLDSETNCQ